MKKIEWLEGDTLKKEMIYIKKMGVDLISFDEVASKIQTIFETEIKSVTKEYKEQIQSINGLEWLDTIFAATQMPIFARLKIVIVNLIA